MQVNFKQIEQRKQLIENARIELKTHFVGIDEIIDELLDYIQIWYLMPEILNRPVIINLWGMTGVGKTDLIRRLVKCLDYQDRFAEVELSNVDSTSWHSSVVRVLEDNAINDGKPSIVLFDEIQRFNTLNPDGTPIQTTKFTDFWELLSDGKLSKRSKDNLDFYIQNYLEQLKDIKKRKDKGEADVEADPMIGLWEARNLKQLLHLDDAVEDLSDRTLTQMIDLLKKAKLKKKVYEPINHSQTLIIISGNLDEAFRMADQISETDVDADIFRAFTEKITLVDVKNALSRKFRPEQVARFGNIHLIYKSLKKENFETLISKEIERVALQTKEKFGIKLTVEDSINTLIYRNGVFPVQGVRPLFSSIIDILETNLTKFLFVAFMNQKDAIKISYDNKAKQIKAKIGNISEIINYLGRIDKIRDKNLRDTIANISVHEAGHAVAYMILFGLAPLQLKSKLASSYASGFTFPHEIYENEENLIKKIKVFLAGGIAEEIIFGANLASIGRSSDREHSTMMVIDYIRRYGFDNEFQATYTISNDPAYLMDKSATDTDVEKMITHLVFETQKLLSAHVVLLRELAIKLLETGSLESHAVAEIGAKHQVIAQVCEEGFLSIPAYQGFLENKQ